jgi:hypothetical protein
MTRGGWNPPTVSLTERICRKCHAPLAQRPDETDWAYSIRQSCGHGRCPGRVRGPLFPFADYPTYAAAPDRCPRDNGIWKLVDEGLQCRTCPGRLRITEALVRMRASGMRFGGANS